VARAHEIGQYPKTSGIIDADGDAKRHASLTPLSYSDEGSGEENRYMQQSRDGE
jgi:hypothetical protein